MVYEVASTGAQAINSIEDVAKTDDFETDEWFEVVLTNEMYVLLEQEIKPLYIPLDNIVAPHKAHCMSENHVETLYGAPTLIKLGPKIARAPIKQGDEGGDPKKQPKKKVARTKTLQSAKKTNQKPANIPMQHETVAQDQVMQPSILQGQQTPQPYIMNQPMQSMYGFNPMQQQIFE